MMRNTFKALPSASFFVLTAVWAAAGISLGAKRVPSWAAEIGDMFRGFALALPFNLKGTLSAMGGHLFWLAAAAAMLLAVYGAGWPAAALARVRTGSAGRLAFRLAAGWLVISMIQHGLGLAGIVFGSLVRIEAVLFLCMGIWLAFKERSWAHSLKAWSAGRVQSVILVFLFFLLFFLARSPLLQEDPRMYHFAAPETYLRIHKIVFERSQMTWQMPLGLEMVYLPAWEIGGVDLAKLVNVGVGFTGALFAGCLAVSLGVSGGAGMWASILFLTSGLVLSQAGAGKNDIGIAMFMTGAAWFGLKATGGSFLGWFLSALFMGAALGVKFTGGFMAAGLLAGLILFAVKRPDRRTVPLVLLAAVLPVSGWLAESFLFTGNPAHPFLSRVFPDLGWGPFYQDALRAYAEGFSPPETKTKFHVLAGVWRVLGDPANGSAALFALLPVALMALRGRKAGALATAAGVSYLLWIFSSKVVRYISPAACLMAPLGMAGLWILVSGNGKEWRAGARAVLAVVLGVAFVKAASELGTHGMLYLAGQESKEELSRKEYTTWEAARRWANRELPVGARILFSGEVNRLWFERRVFSYASVAEPVLWRLANESGTAKEMRKKVRQLGITHHLYNVVSAKYAAVRRYPGPAWSGRQIETYRRYMEKYCRLVYSPSKVDQLGGGFYVLEVSEAPASPANPVLFLPETEGQLRSAALLAMIGKKDEAIKEWEKGAAGMRDLPYAEMEYAIAAYGPGRYEECARILTRVAESGFVGDASIELQGEALLKSRHYDEALKVLCRAWRFGVNENIYKLLSFAFYKRAERMFEDGENASAMREAEHAINLQPRDIKPRLLAVRLLVKLGRAEEARRQARVVLEMAPYNEEASAVIVTALLPVGGL